MEAFIELVNSLVSLVVEKAVALADLLVEILKEGG